MQPKRSKNTPKPISVPEMKSHLAYVNRVRAAATDTERNDALADQLLAFGHRALVVWQEAAKMAPDEQKSFCSGVLDKAVGMYVAWIKGKNLTRRPDEAERRALAGLMLLEERPNLRQLPLNYFAAQAILSLPEGHPRRDTDLTRKCVLEDLAWLRTQGESTSWESLAGALGVAYRERYGTQEELLSWEALAAEAAPHLEAVGALRMWEAVMSYYADLANTDQATRAKWMAEARRIWAIIDALPMTPDLRAESCASAALLYVNDADQRPMAELYKQALDTGTVAPHMARMIATKEALVRMRHGELQRAIELLGPRLEGYE